MTLSHAQSLGAWVGAFVDELARSGVRDVVIAPGSRSTPLALTIAAHPALRTRVLLDERSAAFFALGMARGSGVPVALLCTSGTAGANFLPAVVEAARGGVPLLVLTADRPPELREVGAAQTIDQHRLYGAHAKWFVDVAVPEATPDLLRYARTLACRAAATARAAPAGPVHLNFPFREPLVPAPAEMPASWRDADALAWHGRPDGAPWVRVADAAPTVDAATIEHLRRRLDAARRPLIVCGPQFDPHLAAPLAALADSLGAPLLADPLSQLRWGPHDRAAVISRYDALLRHPPAGDALTPDLVLRIGGLPTSKPLLLWLAAHAAPQIVVDAAGWPDPSLAASDLVHADPRLLCEALHPSLGTPDGDPAWLRRWRHADAAAGHALDAYVGGIHGAFEGRALAEAAAVVPDGGTMVVSSSMPVRDLDAFAAGDERALRVLANRGANGIDGVVSTALGVAASGGGPLLLVIGDLAFYHDMNGLLAAKLHAINATILVLNNDGGGIFSFLPQAAQPAHFEQLFGTPHGLTFAPAAALYGARYTLADSWAALRESLGAGLAGRGLHVVEMASDRATNVGLHRDAWAAVARAFDDGAWAG